MLTPIVAIFPAPTENVKGVTVIRNPGAAALSAVSTCCATTPELLVAIVGVPTYTAAMLCRPAASPNVANVATPPAFSTPDPISIPPSKCSTA